MLIGRLLFAAVFGYLVGSFPTGVLVTRLLGKPDLRQSVHQVTHFVIIIRGHRR